MKKNIGNGESTHIWYDDWLPQGRPDHGSGSNRNRVSGTEIEPARTGSEPQFLIFKNWNRRFRLRQFLNQFFWPFGPARPAWVFSWPFGLWAGRPAWVFWLGSGKKRDRNRNQSRNRSVCLIPVPVPHIEELGTTGSGTGTGGSGTLVGLTSSQFAYSF